MTFAVRAKGKLVVDTVPSHAELAMAHWLAYYSGDYDDSDFNYTPNRLDPLAEFARYPEASLVRVVVHPIELVSTSEVQHA